MVRDGQYKQIIGYKGVANQFLVDMYTSIEFQSLLFVRKNQNNLRENLFNQFKNTRERNDNAHNSRLRIFLPAKFTDLFRYMHKLFFLETPSGADKSFLTNFLLAKLCKV